MGDLLMTCKDREEAFQVIRVYLEELFHRLSGALSIHETDGTGLSIAVRWGHFIGGADTFRLEDCWAVRQGRPHVVENAQSGLICRHLGNPPPASYICLPLMVQSDLLGVLTVEYPEGGSKEQKSYDKLIVTVGETIKLSLSNLRLREELREQAVRDPLTKLYNRRFMEETLSHEVARAQRQGLPLSIAMMDLDFFKNINDSYGHDAGDKVLSEMGMLLQRSLRGTDIACRLGGEEFIIIMPETTLENAHRHCDTIRHRFKTLNILHAGRSIPDATVSIGLATFPDHGHDGKSTLAAADAALYSAKELGRDRVVLAGATLVTTE
jgi:diguanylate cyclase (GGDEF)-like protein